jgi:hypothetical protein
MIVMEKMKTRKKLLGTTKARRNLSMESLANLTTVTVLMARLSQFSVSEMYSSKVSTQLTTFLKPRWALLFLNMLLLE